MNKLFISKNKPEEGILNGRKKICFPGRIRISLITFFMTAILWSCHYLDYSEIDQYDQNEIYAYMDRAKSILTNIYSYLPSDFNGAGLGIDGAMRSSASDDAKDVWEASDIQKFNDGSWNALVTIDDNWSNYYSAIRVANEFLRDAVGRTFPSTQYNLNYKDLMKAYVLYPYEAKFLRAFYYFELIKRYGNVPLVTTVLTPEEADNVQPASYNDIVTFIVTECDSAAAKLPEKYSTFISTETGRATKGAAMALKARTLLYAASPLHNPTNDQAKWISAANAAKAIIDQLGQLGNATYTPLPAYTAAFNSIATGNKELIFERRQAAARSFEVANTAVGFQNTTTGTGTCPTQNLVDAYEVKVNSTTAVPFDWNNPAHAANPYATSGATARDPRLAMSILYNGAKWKTIPGVTPTTNQFVQTYYGGLNGPPTPYTTKTGYYLKKYMIESISLDPTNPGTSNHYWVLFRYTEVLLNYAEAMNEAYGPDAAGPAPLNNLTALAAVNYVRNRTGVAMPGFPAGMTQADFRTRLMNERRVELAFEDHRFWDIRRWKIGPSTRVIKGVDLTKDGTVITCTPKIVETRVWDDKMYLYPIPQTELYLNKNLVQNPGW